ncbi:PAS domain-containing sensor histidine kinase [Undibacterium parvum]|uniref:histidine kinase n=3 Tax=Undibacterium TaxID=401469 RepID=A0A6M4A215_9BURK|nr:PAS domain-containing sensor histidine kinase [Undibacterium parvum]AZP14314.1 PAS domain-containing sensor histidine kinase [Undibacterium parvum]QJQ05204.1 PAS domain S-box protein [Undibacterium piscinae]
MNNAPQESDFGDETAAYTRLIQRVLIILLFICASTVIGAAVSQALSFSRVLTVLALLLIASLSYLQLPYSIRRSTQVLVLGLWLGVSVSTFIFAGVHSANLLTYPFLIALAGWILGRRWLLAVTAISVLFILALGLGELTGVYHPTARAPVLVVVSTVIGNLLAIAFLTQTAYRSLTHQRDHAIALSAQLASQNHSLEQGKRDLRLILDHVPAGVASLDAEAILRFSNARYAELFGAQAEDLLAKKITDYMSPEGLVFMTPYWELCLKGEVTGYRRSYQDPHTGQARVVDVMMEPEISQDNAVTGVFALVIDVTDKLHAEQQIRDLNESLEQRVVQRTAELESAMSKLQRTQEELARSETKATLNTLVASVSHELSTPMGNCLMTAHTLFDQGKSFQLALESNQIKRSDLSNFINAVTQGNDLMLRNVQRAAELLKTFRQVANDQASEQLRAFDLAQMLTEVIDTLAPSLKRYPHQLMLDIPYGIRMHSLPGALGQVTINLINNAYLHAFEGRENGALRISAKLVEQEVHLFFIDDGVGIPEENLKQLFQPFFTTKTGKGGTGLGMGIVENLVNKTLNGTISVSSEVGVGSCFEVHLPLNAPDAPLPDQNSGQT